MFPLTHIYCVKKIKKNPSDLMLLGSIFPDIVISRILNRVITHEQTLDLFNFLKENEPRIADFGIGALSHGEDVKGLDYYSDFDPKPREGYAFKKSKPLIDDVQKVTGLNDILSLVRSHNFIELAIEFLLYQKDPSIINDLKRGEKASYNEVLLRSLSIYFKIDIQNLTEGFKNYFEIIIIPKNLDIVTKGLCNVFKVRDNIKLKDKEIKTILLKAINIIEPTYENDLNDMIEKVKMNIGEYL